LFCNRLVKIPILRGLDGVEAAAEVGEEKPPYAEVPFVDFSQDSSRDFFLAYPEIVVVSLDAEVFSWS
jgi:hypothetical protein